MIYGSEIMSVNCILNSIVNQIRKPNMDEQIIKDIKDNCTITQPDPDSILLCSICHQVNELQANINSCSHLFCYDCIYQWSCCRIIQRLISNSSPSSSSNSSHSISPEIPCPICKAPYTSISQTNSDIRHINIDAYKNVTMNMHNIKLCLKAYFLGGDMDETLPSYYKSFTYLIQHASYLKYLKTKPATSLSPEGIAILATNLCNIIHSDLFKVRQVYDSITSHYYLTEDKVCRMESYRISGLLGSIHTARGKEALQRSISNSLISEKDLQSIYKNPKEAATYTGNFLIQWLLHEEMLLLDDNKVLLPFVLNYFKIILNTCNQFILNYSPENNHTENEEMKEEDEVKTKESSPCFKYCDTTTHDTILANEPILYLEQYDLMNQLFCFLNQKLGPFLYDWSERFLYRMFYLIIRSLRYIYIYNINTNRDLLLPENDSLLSQLTCTENEFHRICSSKRKHETQSSNIKKQKIIR